MAKKIRKVAYISLAVLGLYCMYKAVAFHVYAANYAKFSTYISYGSELQNMPDEFIVCAIEGVPKRSPIKFTQISYYPQQQQLVFGLITSQNQEQNSHVVIKKGAENIGVLSTGMAKDFVLKRVRQAWYELDYPLVFGEKYLIEYYIQDECVYRREIVFSKDSRERNW